MRTIFTRKADFYLLLLASDEPNSNHVSFRAYLLADLGDCIKPQSQLADEEVKLLVTSLPYIVQHGRAIATVDKYRSG